jgi:hypothetical protein
VAFAFAEVAGVVLFAGFVALVVVLPGFAVAMVDMETAILLLVGVVEFIFAAPAAELVLHEKTVTVTVDAAPMAPLAPMALERTD